MNPYFLTIIVLCAMALGQSAANNGKQITKTEKFSTTLISTIVTIILVYLSTKHGL